MKKWLIFGAVVALGLTGCTSSTTAEPSPTPTAEASTYLDDMRDTRGFVGADDAAIEQVGKSVCAALEDGTSLEEAAHYLALGGLTDEQAETAAYLSADEYCPDEGR